MAKCSIFLIALVGLCMVTGDEVVQYKLRNNNKLRKTFNKLLETVTAVNEERLDSLKKFFEIQNYLPVGVGRTKDNIVAVIVPNLHSSGIVPTTSYKILNTLRNELDSEENSKDFSNEGSDLEILQEKNYQNIDDNKEVSEENSDGNGNGSSVLRGWKGCNKSAARACKKACKRAYKDVCDDYRCSRSMKKSFKRACKRTCYSQFSTGYSGYSSSDEYYK